MKEKIKIKEKANLQNCKSQVKGNISSIESMGLVDGPGIRYVVFLQGCKLRCKYCHNPETWIEGKGKITITPKELIEKIKKFKNYFGKDGGVTFSGGEPLRQPEFLLECLKLCKEEGIHTTIDTAGVGFGEYQEILQYTDLVILDIKAVDKILYLDLTGQENSIYLKFLNDCQKLGKKMWLRQVIVPGINDDEEHVMELKKFASKLKNIERIELLPYKTIGEHKYNDLGIAYRLEGVPEMDEKKCKELEKLLKKT